MSIANFLELRDDFPKDVSSFERIRAIQVSHCTAQWAMNKPECQSGPLQPVRGARFWFEKRTPNNNWHGL
jgi:hypothetical protein